jgi:hypothetical protein
MNKKFVLVQYIARRNLCGDVICLITLRKVFKGEMYHTERIYDAIHHKNIIFVAMQPKKKIKEPTIGSILQAGKWNAITT